MIDMETTDVTIHKSTRIEAKVEVGNVLRIPKVLGKIVSRIDIDNRMTKAK